MLERFTAGRDDIRVTGGHDSSRRNRLNRDIANVTEAFNSLGSGFNKHMSKDNTKAGYRDLVGAGAQFKVKGNG